MLTATTNGLIGLSTAVGAVVWARAGQIPHHGLTHFLWERVTLLNVSFSIVFAVLWAQCVSAFGLYRRDLDGARSLMVRAAAASATMTVLLGLYLQARHARGPQGEILLAFLAGAFLYQTSRVLLWTGGRNWQIGQPDRVVILGSGRRASKAWRQLRLYRRRTRQLVGFVDDRSPTLMAPDIATRYIGTLHELSELFSNEAVDELIVAVPLQSCYELAQRAVAMAQAVGVRVVCLNDLFALQPERVADRQQTVFLELVPKRQKAAVVGRRLVDVFRAAPATLALPVFVAVSVATKLTSPGSVLALDLKILASAVPAILKRL